ncbi:hypothetical protein PGT21_020889 [Puccinia graminis f. sp. tritici]|uniref:Syntaxin n=1 Tax=Puccinia graminis f. sp. tritici TaxID=56615 RepID=A0A5B0LQI0_PUCGR|nr:hypothetical protein PGT21_020889 [Puccinia graminis f. sp. tritici]
MEVQSIAVKSFEIIKPKDSSKPYVLYTIEIGTKLKSYTICRRYSQFERLSEDLKLELDSAVSRRWLPILPPKSTSLVGYLTGSGSLINQPSKIAERQAGLERWLKTVIVHKELKDKTSKSRALMDFLEIPSSLNSTSSSATHKSSHMDDHSANPFTSQSWLAEHNEIRASVREMYDLLSRRDELLHQSTSTSVTLTKLNQINVDGKRNLENITARLGRLTESLKLFTQPDTPKGRGTLTEGETSRRMQLISTLQDDCERLSKKILARAEIGTGIRQANQVLSSESASRDRAELLGTHSNGSNSRPTTRVLGGGGPTGSASRNLPAEETVETRQRDNRRLMDHQLNHVIAQTQDDKLKSLTQILSRQKLLGLMINQELAEQNEILDDLDRDVDSASRKLKEATKKINRLT